VAPDVSLSGYEPLEAHWRNPALASLGFAASFGGVTDYVRSIRTAQGTRWGYAAFFTKYPTNHFAYAGKPRLVMQYANDGWGPDNIDRVFTHETGHIFGCPDEYSASGCRCDAKAGFLREPNANCQSCAPSFVECLMAANTWAMCPHTLVHFGWRDTDADGTFDPVDPTSTPSPIDLRSLCSIAPWLCQLLGLGSGTAAAGIVGVRAAEGVVEAEPAVPLRVLRGVLDDETMARVQEAVRNEEMRYVEAVERKLRAAIDQLERVRAESVSIESEPKPARRRGKRRT
jgi:hypothetical protein